MKYPIHRKGYKNMGYFNGINNPNLPYIRVFTLMLGSPTLSDVEKKMNNYQSIAILLLGFLNLKGNKDQETAILTRLATMQQQIPSNLQGLLHEILFETELPNVPKRGLIITLLGRIGFQNATEILKEILMDKSENRYVRGAAAEALGQLHRKDTIPLLLEYALNEEEDVRVRSATIISLGWLHDENVIPILLTLIDHPKSEVWLSASDALLNFEQESLTRKIFQIYLQYHENEGKIESSRIPELLIERNLIPLLPNASFVEQKILGELIVQQGGSNIPHLEFIQENTTNKELLKLIGDLLEKIQPLSLEKIRL
jgi:HEAT repeat protein